METIVIHPENEAQQKALQMILDGFKVPYEKEPILDATAYLVSTKANKSWLDTALSEANGGEGVAIKLEDIWK